MAVEIVPVLGGNTPATGLSVTWEKGQFVMIITSRGLVACGIVDMMVAREFSFAVAVAHGTPEHPLVTVNDLLKAIVSDVTPEAERLGVRAGQTGQEALDALSRLER